MDYDKEGSALRIRGKNILQNEHVKVCTEQHRLPVLILCKIYIIICENEINTEKIILEIEHSNAVRSVPYP